MTQTLTANANASADQVRVTRLVAIVAGLLGFVLALLTPLLPVVQTTATLNWPQNGELKSVTAPLISLTPVSMTATVPCDVIREMPPKGGMVLGLAPQKAKDASLNSLFVTVDAQRVNIADRNVVVASVPRAQVQAAGCQRIEIISTEDGTFASFIGVPPSPDYADLDEEEKEKSPQTGYDYLRSGFDDPNLRPGIVGVFTDLTGPAPPGLSVSATIDTRFTTRPTAIKLAAMLLAMAATAVALSALWRLDRLDGGCTG